MPRDSWLSRQHEYLFVMLQLLHLADTGTANTKEEHCMMLSATQRLKSYGMELLAESCIDYNTCKSFSLALHILSMLRTT